MTLTKSERDKLEQEILDRMPTLRPYDMPVMQDAMSRKTDAQLEDILKRMKEDGR